MDSEKIKCPSCGSQQVAADKKGFSGGKAVVGGLLAGPLGILAGTIGKNKVMITCMRCGHKWKAGEHIEKSTPTQKPTQFHDKNRSELEQYADLYTGEYDRNKPVVQPSKTVQDNSSGVGCLAVVVLIVIAVYYLFIR